MKSRRGVGVLEPPQHRLGWVLTMALGAPRPAQHGDAFLQPWLLQ